MLLIIALLSYNLSTSQIVNIPDPRFKNALVNWAVVDTDSNGVADSDIDTNDDGEIQVSEAEVVDNLFIGGETFEIRKKPRDVFIANAGNDTEIDKNETITITAGQINEDAVYNWYDPKGNLIYTVTALTVSPDITKKYKLEIISNIDGSKDYDEVEIIVNLYKLESLIPNPASNQVTINYIADGASSAYVMVVNMNTENSDNYILDTQQSSASIDVSIYTTGLYNIILVCDGEVQNSKNFIKQ